MSMMNQDQFGGVGDAYSTNGGGPPPLQFPQHQQQVGGSPYGAYGRDAMVGRGVGKLMNRGSGGSSGGNGAGGGDIFERAAGGSSSPYTAVSSGPLDAAGLSTGGGGPIEGPLSAGSLGAEGGGLAEAGASGAAATAAEGAVAAGAGEAAAGATAASIGGAVSGAGAVGMGELLPLLAL